MRTAVHIIADNISKLEMLRRMVERNFSYTATLLRRGPQNYSLENVVVAADLGVTENVAALKQSFASAAPSRKRIFLVEQKMRLFAVQAFALGATDVMFGPVAEGELCSRLVDSVPLEPAGGEEAKGAREAASGGARAIASMFSAVVGGRAIDPGAAIQAAAKMADTIEDDGLSNWLDTVRQHHEGTYQHCLLVTGIAIEFGLTLGLARADITRLYAAAMFHDVGKASISAAILNKPGRLDPDERRLIETHPAAGYEHLKGTPGISPEVLDAVRHHHEFLDGSGYPDGLGASGISDVVRMLTISDIFAALIEDRRYKPPMPREQAFEILLGMRGKLEAPLVGAFRKVALGR